jgi:hypothetical protein
MVDVCEWSSIDAVRQKAAPALTEISYPFWEAVGLSGDRKASARERPAFGRLWKNRRRALAPPHDARFPGETHQSDCSV